APKGRKVMAKDHPPRVDLGTLKRRPRQRDCLTVPPRMNKGNSTVMTFFQVPQSQCLPQSPPESPPGIHRVDFGVDFNPLGTLRNVISLKEHRKHAGGSP